MSDQPTLTHGTCPHCGHNGCYTEWANGGFKCHSCDATPKTHGRKVEYKKEEMNPLDLKPSIKPYRNLVAKAVEKYGIVTQSKDGKDFRRDYVYPHGTKHRILPKDFSKNAGFTGDHLFGMDKFNSGSHESITIVEGEDDCPAAYMMLGGKEAVVALPSASISSKLLKNCHDYLDGFKSIIICTDNDDAGNKAATKLATTFPTKVYRVNLTKFKDPMEYLEKGEVVDFKAAWKNRTKYVPEFDTSTPDAYLKILDESEADSFIPTGIEEYDKRHLGLFQGHVTIFTAPEGTGKTELFHYFEHHLLSCYPEIPFASCHLEESKQRTMLGWSSYDLNKNVTRKDLIEDMNEVRNSIQKLTESENAHLFKIGVDDDPYVILDRVRFYATVFGCKYIFLEPIQDLAQQSHSEPSDERFLSKIAVGLARLADELNVGIVLIAHENDDGLISDCRKLGKQASVVVKLEREIDHPDPDIRNTTTLRSKKNRPTAFVGFAGQMRFDANRFVLEEHIE